MIECKDLGEIVKVVPRPCCGGKVTYYKCNKKNMLVREIECEQCKFLESLPVTEQTKILNMDSSVDTIINSLPNITRSRNGNRRSTT